MSLLATQDVTGNDLPDWDGSTWDPWAKRLLLTSEAGPAGGVWQATPDYPSRVRDISSVLGRGGYEGIQNDDRGNVYIVEDVGGKTGSAAAGLSHAKQPNSFVYRFLPNDPAALRRGGTLQALQVIDASGQPIMFGGTSAEAIDADLTSPQNRALRSYGHRFATRWVDLTLNDAYDANAAAKAAGATPFKRPENGQFRPGSGFSEFYFDETGDTTLLTPEEAAKDPGGYGSVFRLDQSPESNEGSISLVYAGDAEHAAFDNLAFASRDLLAVVEDAGDALHTARNALDSGYLLDVTEDYGAPGAAKPVRWLAEGRDPSATIDSGLSGQPGFTNDGDNEITGIHISNGNPHKQGILGAQIPTPFRPRSGTAGASSGPSSTVTTSPGSSCRPPEPAQAVSIPPRAEPGPDRARILPPPYSAVGQQGPRRHEAEAHARTSRLPPHGANRAMCGSAVCCFQYGGRRGSTKRLAKERRGWPTGWISASLRRRHYVDVAAAPRAVVLQLEVKAHADPALAARTVEVLAALHGVRGRRVEVLSFSAAACERAASLGLHARLVIWADYAPAAFARWARRHGVVGVCAEHYLLSAQLIAALRAGGLSVTTGTP